MPESTVPVDSCSIAGPNGTRIPTEEPHAWVSRKGPDNIWVRTCQLCPAIDWDDLRETVAFAETFTSDTSPASMGGPLSEADRLAEIRNRAKHQKVLDHSLRGVRAKDHVAAVDDRDFLLGKADALLAHNGVLVTEVRFQAERADSFRSERDEARARVGVLEGQLATARELARDWQRQIGVEKDRADDDRLTEVERAEGLQRAAQLKRHARQLHEALGPDPAEANSVALGLDGGGSDER